MSRSGVRWWAAFVVFGAVFAVQVVGTAITLVAGHLTGADLHDVMRIAGSAATIVVLWLATSRTRQRAREILKLRSAPIWSYFFVPLVAVLVGPWNALVSGFVFADVSGGAKEPLQLLTLVVVVLLVPPAEEALFRGYIFSALEQRSRVAAVLGSTILFGLAHGGIPVWAWVTHLPFGLVMALAVIRFRSIYPPIVTHALWNLASMFGHSPDTWFEPTVVPLVGSALALAVCVGVVVTRGAGSEEQQEREPHAPRPTSG